MDSTFLLLVACGTHTAPSEPEPEPVSGAPWQLGLADGVAGLVGERVFAWDRAWADGSGGIAEYDARNGRLLRTRTIEGLNINGAPSFWEAVPGGYLADWHAPTFIREDGDRLSVGWVAASSDWFDSHALVDDTLVIGQSRDRAAVVRLALADGRELWRAPLVAWSQDITVSVERGVAYATWQEYDPDAPTPTMTIPRRLRAYDLATGTALWTHDFRADPDGLVASAGVIIAVQGGVLEFIDGATGTLKANPALKPLNGRLLLDGDQVIAVDERDIVAFEVATGRERWRTPLPYDGRPLLTRWADSMLVSAKAGKVAALNRSTGTLQWSVGLGVTPYYAWISPTALLWSGAGVVGMALPPSGAPESVRIRGRVLGDCGPRLTIDGQSVPLGPNGTYEHSLVGRGRIIVHAFPPASELDFERPPSGDAIAFVLLSGRGDYTVPDLIVACKPQSD